MPKVSKNPLTAEMKRDVIGALTRTLTEINDREFLERFIDDLLTPTEKLMLGKRLMAAVLIQRGYGYGAICRVLKMSKATVWVIQRDLVKSGVGYKKVFDLFFKEAKGQKIVNAIEKFLGAVTLPVRAASEIRWQRHRPRRSRGF
ncbi:MAG: hypothetical protein HYW90_04220 [Candidatus Sungbacteria bacterium]|nr:hypothetical protein [Candidatus Sungbacteria bacterium]